jgi:hypothetical protein
MGTLAMEKWSGRRCRRRICHDDDAGEKKGKVGVADGGEEH